MTKVLIIDDDRSVRELLKRALAKAGYDVIETKDGSEGFERARYERPSVILLDVMMPRMNGFEVLEKLKGNHITEAIPVILLTGVEAAEGEQTAMRLGVRHYITKPWEPGVVESAVKVALAEDQAGNDGAQDLALREYTGAQVFLGTGNLQLDQILNGGVPLGSLTLMEGVPTSGKSILCHHLSYQSLRDGYGVVYLTSERSYESIVNRMRYIGRDVSDYLQQGRLAILPIAGNTEHLDSGALMPRLATGIEDLPIKHQVMVLDCISDLVSQLDGDEIIGFFTSCKRVCDRGGTIIVVARSYAFDPYALDQTMLARLRALCDVHLTLHIEKIGKKLSRVLEVRKLHNVDLTTGNAFRFDIESGFGIQNIASKLTASVINV